MKKYLDFQDENEIEYEDEIEIEEEKFSFWEKGTLFHGILFFIVPILLFYLMEGYEHNAFLEVRPLAQVYNILLFELIAWLLYFITGSGKTALRIETVVALVYGLVNHYVMAFRSTPFVPWDIFSIGTAASVAGNYDFTPTTEVIYITGALVAIFILVFFVKLEFPYGALMRVIPVLCIGVVLTIFVNLLWDDEFQINSYLYPHLFTPAYMTTVNGMAVTFVMDLEYVYVEKPENYSVDYAKEILAEYENSPGTLDVADYPNVIVVMNEAFSDLSVLGEFTVNEDYMPFIHSLQSGAENTITGELLVSVCGGNTANTEFEFLTGHTMDYFPVGSIPYQQYITGELPSLASQLQGLGYSTYAMHPYGASGWSRDTVYPLLGFEQAYFLEDFKNRYYIRKYVSDATAYDKIIDTYEAKEEGTPAFIFEVTMQNHSGYTEEYKSFPSDIDVVEFENPALEQYLSLIKVSDEELENLIQYFEKEEEETIIVFFGDHQPSDSVANQILAINGINISDMTVEEAQLRYKVPYVIWANYDIEEATDVDTDISFLGAKLMDTAGMPTTAYQNFLLDLEASLTLNENSTESQELLKKYEILQYYYMFDYREE